MSGPVAYRQDRFPPDAINWTELVPLIGPANAAIARYEEVLRSVPNPELLLAPLTAQEAVFSSRIEGTQATLGEVLEYEAEGGKRDESTPKLADIWEILNYRSALRLATDLLKELPLSQRLIKATHAALMQGVRGRSKAPGEYRRIANWIGSAGSPIERARFIPCRADRIEAAMTAWERYIHASASDLLVQLAIVHAEFEAIHPFLDGNGRLGRLILPLFLHTKGLLSSPSFYLSEYLEQHRDEYYDRLLAVSRDGDWTGWCAFFLRSIIAQAEINQGKARAILALYRERKDWIAEVTRSQYAVRALDWMFVRPTFRTSDFIASSGIPPATANRIVRIVREHGLLREVRAASGRRPSVLAFTGLLDIVDGGAVG